MAKKISFYSLFTVFALIISYLEGLIFAFVPIPGFKIGLANTISMILISRKKISAGILVNILRILLSSLLFGNIYSFIFSLSGGILSTVIVILFIKFKCFSFAGVSTAAAVAHNIAQIFAAALILNTHGLLFLLPVLIITGGITGFVCGICVNVFLKKYSKILNNIV